MIEPVKIGDATLLTGDVIECLKTLEADSVQCVVTSPPYWGLRDYKTATWEGGDAECDHAVRENPHVESSGLQGGKKTTGHQAEGFAGDCKRCGAIRHDKGIGLEPTFAEWLARMVEVCREVRRVLRPDGTFWLNIGDAYANVSGGQVSAPEKTKNQASPRIRDMARFNGFKPKDLLLMPARLAIALQEDGWWVRSDIIWSKLNPMPESCTDRPTSAHEHVFLLTKAGRYFYDADAVREEMKPESYARYDYGFGGPKNEALKAGDKPTAVVGNREATAGRNLRNVWTIATQPYPEAHFATFPEALPMKCIMAGTSERGCCPECGAPWKRIVEKSREIETETCSSWDIASGGHGTINREGRSEKEKRIQLIPTEFGWQPTCDCVPPDEVKKHWEPSRDGEEKRRYWTEKIWHNEPPTVPCTVLDPFCGSCTTGLVSLELGRRYIGTDLNPDYLPLRIKRIEQEAKQGKLF